ncbi:hypothetical protein Aduo_004797 [Ancylostoma duodenale]
MLTVTNFFQSDHHGDSMLAQPRLLHVFRRFFGLIVAFSIIGVVVLVFDHSVTYKQNFRRRKEVNDANYRARKMFQNVKFKDSRLQVARYIAVPKAAMCSNTTFIVVVHMRAEDHARRRRWRATYGNHHLRENFKYNLIFSIGIPSKTRDHDLITEESEIYGDILQADYIDAYRNITYKQLAELRYFASSCENITAVVKLDDDVAWSVNKTAEFISKKVHPNELYCARRDSHTPMTHEGMKWSITKEEWGRGQFPVHCLGMIYIVSLSAVRRMLATVHLQKFFWIDDVFITGVLTEASNVSVRNIVDIIGEGVRYPEEVYFREVFFAISKEDSPYWFFVANHQALVP